MTYLVARPRGEIDLGDEPCPWSFEIPEGVDRDVVLQEARDATSRLHRFVTFQVARMAEATGVKRSPSHGGDGPTITGSVLATRRRKIAETMRRLADVGHDVLTIATLRGPCRL